VADHLVAQNQNGKIQLQIKDTSGAAMEAAGKLESSDAGVKRRFHTDVQGRVRLENLPSGSYHVEISRAGFATESLAIELGAGKTVSQTITMQPASQSFQTDVVSTTPLTGADLTADQIASPVQTASSVDIKNSGSLDLADFLNRRLNGVYFNEMQENPFQPDVNYRGYTASPLLGTPEGISVYVDGVRQNQPFGDVVSWDLIARDSISEVTLVPGSDPLFGLNTLGGALSVTTKSGITNPGISGSVLYGSSGRKAVEGEWGGGGATGFNWFLSGMGFHESGWRYASPSDVRQGFARLGWRNTKTDLALTMSYAYNTLLGNGLQDYRLLDQNYTSSYSVPDSTANRSPSFNFIARHSFSDALTFTGNAWYRNIRTETINPNFNGDVAGNDIYQPTADEQAALTAAGYTGFPTAGADISNTPFPKWPCIAEAITPGGNPDGLCNGVNIYGKQVQNEFGLSGQFSLNSDTRIGHNLFAAGALFDRGVIDYTQATAFAYTNPDYSLTNVPAWQEPPVDLHGVTPNWSLFFTDTVTLPRNINLTVSGRYNRATVNNTDLVNPVAGPGSLTGDYTFQRFNPAVGLTWSPVSSLNVYARYSQGSRAPTSIELGCADPDAPCSLPNSLSSDPPLAQVVTYTWEAGLRGKLRSSLLRNLGWNLDAFHAENHNDILFIAAPIIGTGYFQNFAKTRREGVDASIDGSVNRFAWGLDWTLLSATYQSVETLDGSANNTNDVALQGYPGLSGIITVHPGNRIPLIPKQIGKAYLDCQPVSRLGFDLNEVVASSSYARGNENNAYQADGVYYQGPGVSPGYAVTNFRVYYDFAKHFQLALQIDNLFDHKYYTAAQLSGTALTTQGAFQSTPYPVYESGPYAGSFPAQSVTFFSPGAPRRAWVQLGIKF
jgi:outer membrane receptor protein involved in Fe transport